VVELEFHPEAEAEYSDATLWYAQQSATASARFEIEVERAINRIIEAPESFSRYDERHRFILVSRYPYSVVYRIKQECVHVVAVAHSSRAPGYWQDRVS
jgi:toxin ParE1/3/4